MSHRVGGLEQSAGTQADLLFFPLLIGRILSGHSTLLSRRIPQAHTGQPASDGVQCLHRREHCLLALPKSPVYEGYSENVSWVDMVTLNL